MRVSNPHQWNAADYHQNSAMQLTFANDLMRRLTLRGDERVLDIGCGDGKITAEMARQLPHGSTLGVDISAAMIAFAQRTFSSAHYPNLAFRVMSASHLDFQNEFDLVVSFSALHWVIDHQPVLTGIARSLKPSGRVLMQFGGKGNMGVLHNIAQAIPLSPKWRGYFKAFVGPWGFYGADEYRQWLARAGLRAERVELVPKAVWHKGRAGFQAWIRTAWPPYMQRIPEHLRQAFLDDLTDQYLARHPINHDGLVHVRMVRLEIEATKLWLDKFPSGA